jgi:hypothetical protein
MWLRIQLSIMLGLLWLPAEFSAAEELGLATAQGFLKQNCFDCHQGSDAEGGLDLTKLSRELSDPEVMARWVRIFDRVDEGEMPPEDAGELDRQEASSFLKATETQLVRYQNREHTKLGRVRSRRLTNQQLERTLHDLLAIDVPLASLMPEEQRTDGFTNIAEGQPMSHFQLATHLAVVDAALEAAFDRASESDQDNWSRDYTARQIARRNPRQRNRDPEMINGKAVVWSSTLVFYGRITSTTVRESGWYRFNVKASSVNQLKDRGVWCSVRTGRCTSGAPLMTWVGAIEATEDPQEWTFEGWIPKDHMIEIRPADATLRKARFQGGQVGAGEGGPQRVPGVAMHSMSIERIHPGGDIETVRRYLLGDLKSDASVQQVTKQLQTFIRRAFRRPVTPQTMQPYVQMLNQSIESGIDPIETLRKCYRAVLCSPRFLYLVESPGQLDEFAIASRLSYLLWDSMPDWQLSKLAREGKLSDPKVLRQQVSRMLKGKNGHQFIKDFAAQWLDLMDIDFTEPDRKLYKDFDIVTQDAMLAETHRFLHGLLSRNASAATLINADFTFLNSRLARYYGIEGVEGDRLQRVSLSADSHRGGLLTHGSILKVTANGTNTSPVLRGVWVSERILGTPIPPPPENVPAVEPDIRGAKTIREQLEKHLSDSDCAACHYKIDPPGYALENFDAAGRWRDSYLQVKSGRAKRSEAKIDSSFTLPDGRDFKDFDEFRELISQDPRPIARNFVEKLLVYGTGAPITFADRAVVDQIVDDAADENYGLRTLLDGVVTSSTFQNK